ncbi:MAG: 2-hydroxyacyl-CoA dehydratase [Oscillospiraceae bacterium]|nr:2-hydroxyacyl-CoA dehydratase [Oscillospiraceae bacterium]
MTASGSSALCSLGIDIGSTTAKVVLMEGNTVLYEKYERHLSQVRTKALEMITEIRDLLIGRAFTAAISGSAGLGLAEAAGLPFVQEVYATGEVVKALEPDTSVVIELGGEDAKVIFFAGGTDERMNGTCAGGTGAFIDQMAILLNMTVDEMDAASLQHTRLYPIASRCGVFAKTDIQPLLNQGAAKADVAASIYQAVVNQTISGLAQGRRISGKVMFLGGPLHYCQGLRDRFRETLKLTDETAVFPEYGRFAVAMGAAMFSRKDSRQFSYETITKALANAEGAVTVGHRLPPLFASEDEYLAFRDRHAKATVEEDDISSYAGDAWLGIDCGSTTTKLALISDENRILYSFYSSNRGNPVELVREQLSKIYELCGDRITIRGSAVTGYGEQLIEAAFQVDAGVVETIAHYTAARYFQPDVDFILDIGGQDIKCFRIRNGAIDSIMLNEACSSGCGSFIETFARSMGYGIEEFAALGLRGKSPVDLGSRCTVFMNSSVKQSQKEGATVEDISAGLSVSVVKNAVYKVIRASSARELGQHIVVQGGTFLNDAVLRAFEMEMDGPVIRPAIAGLMGAYGAALYARKFRKSTLLSRESLASFSHTSRAAVCRGCTNQCRLIINTFADGRRLISGNQCQRGLGLDAPDAELPNLYAYKRDYLAGLTGRPGKRGKIGIPMALGMYELAPLWHAVFTELGYEVVFSRLSTRRTYERGQFSIPSDTACYPAKIMHGHMEELMDEGLDTLFYPVLTYNVDEQGGTNHYNCPIVAYYSELLNGNMDRLKEVTFLYPNLNINSPRAFTATLFEAMHRHDPSVTRGECRRAVEAGLEAYDRFRRDVMAEGERAVAYARAEGKRIMILAGRPYHIDPEIGHGIDKLAVQLGFVVVSEDSVCHLEEPQRTRVLNQWTYHSRLYRAARYATHHKDTELVQLVSFGCGIDAITTDECRSILEPEGKFYTQLKIDEITNLGAVRIRLRSLLGALEAKEGEETA